MRDTGIAIITVGVIELLFSLTAFVFFSQATPTSFATFWAASGLPVWAPQCLAGVLLIVIGGAMRVLGHRRTTHHAVK